MLGVRGITVCCASTGGLVNMTRALALEVAPDVRVNCVCPGYVDTDMIRRDHIDKKADPAAAEQRMIDYAPMKRIATPAEIESSPKNSVPAFRFTHAHGDGFYVNNERQPEDSVAVTQEKLLAMLEQAGLEIVRPIELGYWHEGRSDTVDFGQDLALLSHATR